MAVKTAVDRLASTTAETVRLWIARMPVPIRALVVWVVPRLAVLVVLALGQESCSSCVLMFSCAPLAVFTYSGEPSFVLKPCLFFKTEEALRRFLEFGLRKPDHPLSKRGEPPFFESTIAELTTLPPPTTFKINPTLNPSPTVTM